MFISRRFAVRPSDPTMGPDGATGGFEGLSAPTVAPLLPRKGRKPSGGLESTTSSSDLELTRQAPTRGGDLASRWVQMEKELPHEERPQLQSWLQLDLSPDHDIDYWWDLVAQATSARVIYERPLAVPAPSVAAERAVEPQIQSLDAILGKRGREHARSVSGRTYLSVLEGGWNLRHPALRRGSSAVAARVGGQPFAQLSAHGDATIGLLAGQPFHGLEPGILPDATLRLYSSIDPRGLEAAVGGVCAAIAAHRPTRKAGARSPHVLLVEAQAQFMSRFRGSSPLAFVLAPVEVDPAVHAAFRVATRHGITVVEPAGNGGVDLGATVLDVFGGAFRGVAKSAQPLLDDDDCGAIRVGAAWRGPKGNGPWQRFPTSNYGKPVHVWAWGAGVQTASMHWNVRRSQWQSTTNPFMHTSAAAAIVAGMVAAAQGARLEAGKLPLAPVRLRALLQSAADPGDGDIPLQPDLAKFIEVVVADP